MFLVLGLLQRLHITSVNLNSFSIFVKLLNSGQLNYAVILTMLNLTVCKQKVHGMTYFLLSLLHKEHIFLSQ